ncbi:DNA-directed RNA polymerase [Tricharina praecox]|uniref:DNA-directed RNA polymerase n=1 Tax=Tricharina praecox TaxID=43433 RepID=UPI00221FBBDD|nr:DNA-directed RNA polymerase [Tricharina praecox]KAI5842699.1 DNA-directed RNA polymerase [Tricharina praecox]
MPSADTDRRDIVGINAETISNVTSNDFPGHWPGEDNSWDLSKFRDSFRVDFFRNDRHHAEFDIVHIDASIANAFRRIMMAEVHSFAIEQCYFLNNTSVIQDEVLAHRLGFIPIVGNHDAMKSMKWPRQGKNPENNLPYQPTVHDTLILQLQAQCERIPNVPKGETDPDKLYTGHTVYARDLEWRPANNAQQQRFGDDPVRAGNPDIVIAKLRPGQEIIVTSHAVKGLGKDHAKFSPVATCGYRLMPQITILEPIRGKSAERFQGCFPKGVVEIEDGEAKVVNARNDTVSREVLRHEEFKGKVALGRIRDHFIYFVESAGQWDSDEIFLEAVGILQAKCERLKRHTQRMLQQEAEKADREGSIESETGSDEPEAMEE